MKRAEYQSTQEQAQAVRNQWETFRSALAKATPRELPRTYGFEIETPEADTVRDNALRALRQHNAELEAEQGNGNNLIRLDSILLWKGDGSVTGENQNEECECECQACVYHECDCDDCENRNTDPEHNCGNDDCYNQGTYQEITSVDGTTTTHPLSLKILRLAELANAEINDTCGLHIHIGSSDLTPTQVAQVVSAYRAITPIINTIAERANVYYCQANTDEDIALTRQGQGTQKYRAVNTAPHFSTFRPDTIEFRQHAGTNNPAEVRAFAVLLVHLVEYAKANRPVYWLARCADFTELAKELHLTIQS